MDEKEYVEMRLDDQIAWYDRKSSWNQNWFKWLRIVEILAAASIPFLTGYISANTLEMKNIVGSLGVVIAVVSGILALYKFQEHW